MVQWLAMLQLLWLQQLLLLGIHQGIAQDLTHIQEPSLEWRGECPQRRTGG
jgi:C-type mannose receptor